jgi:agmatinase
VTENTRPVPADWQEGPRYGGGYTFMRAPAGRDLRHCDVVIVGLPFDSGTTYRPGARMGPRGIRDASGQMRPHARQAGNLEEPFASLRILDYGDLELSPGYTEQTFARIEAGLAAIVESDTLPVCLGGDHSITLPILRALSRKHGVLSLVHFDAHPDFWEGRADWPHHHGTTMRTAVNEKLIDPRRTVQVGIRGSLSASILDDARRAGFHLITADDFVQRGAPAVLEDIRRIAQGPTYVSLDIDCVDPAFAPGTGTPEVAGLTSRDIVELTRGLRGLSVVGFDLVEVAPPYDPAEITCLLAANLVYEFLLTLPAR